MANAKKQTSSRISTQAARLLARLPKYGTFDIWGDNERERELVPRVHFALPLKLLRSLLASLVSQDETPGQLSPKQRRAVREGVKSARKSKSVYLDSFAKSSRKRPAKKRGRATR